MAKSTDDLALLDDRRAMTAWEYALIAALMTVAIVAAAGSMGTATKLPFQTLINTVNWGGK